jgi:hypothetical protein
MWKAKLNDGREVSELNTKWEDVKENVVELLLITNDNKIIYLPKNMKGYTQFKSASAELGSKGIQIESRVVGCKVGNNIIKIRVDEKTNNIKIEVD